MQRPHLLFLDEPTSGLDSASSHDLILKLKAYAVRKGAIVVVILHQPTAHTFRAFDVMIALQNVEGDANRILFSSPPAATDDGIATQLELAHVYDDLPSGSPGGARLPGPELNPADVLVAFLQVRATECPLTAAEWH